MYFGSSGHHNLHYIVICPYAFRRTIISYPSANLPHNLLDEISSECVANTEMVSDLYYPQQRNIWHCVSTARLLAGLPQCHHYQLPGV